MSITERRLTAIYFVFEDCECGPHGDNANPLVRVEGARICSNCVVRELVSEVRRLRKDAQVCEDQFFSSNIEIDNLRKMLLDLRQERDSALERERIHRIQAIEAIKERNTLRELAAEMLSTVESGWLCSIGSINNTREVQISVDAISAWREVLTPQPVPMCRLEQLPDPGDASAHPLEKLVDQALEEGGNPT